MVKYRLAAAGFEINSAFIDNSPRRFARGQSG